MAEVAYARGPAFLGAPRSLSKKNENAEPENAGPQKMRSEKARGPRKRGAPVNVETESAEPQKTRGPTKRFYNENGITKTTQLHCSQLHYKIFGL